MPWISIQADIKPALAALSAAQRQQVPFATAKALTALAFEVQRVENAGMSEVFKHPRPFTQRATIVDKATKQAPRARVRVKDAQARYLAPFEFGGLHFVPGKGIALMQPVNVNQDAYGQIRGRPSTLASKPNTFAGAITFKKSGRTIWGIWQRPTNAQRRDGTTGTKGALGQLQGVTTGLKLLIEATQPVMTKQHLDFVDRAQVLITQRAAIVFGQELGKSLASARG